MENTLLGALLPSPGASPARPVQTGLQIPVRACVRVCECTRPFSSLQLLASLSLALARDGQTRAAFGLAGSWSSCGGVGLSS